MEKKETKKVSIILPVYNGERYLKTSIESCINQTYQNWQLIIIDDGSSDKSAEIAKYYESKDYRIHYYKNPQNIKLPKSLNRGFSLAEGEYLTWTSDDNYYKPQALRKMINALERRKGDFVFTACSIIDESGKKISQSSAPEDFYNAIWDYNFIGACFMYTRKVYESIGEYDPEVFLCEDYDYWLRIMGKYKVVYLDEELYAWRKHDKALSSAYKKEQYRMMEKVLLKNFSQKSHTDRIGKFYLYRGLHRSRSLENNILRKYHYFPVLIGYKIWHRFYMMRQKNGLNVKKKL